MTQAISIEEGWIDIIPPEIPAASADPMAILFFVLPLAVLLLIGIIHRRRPRQRARRALRRLARDLRRTRVEAKTACFEIRRWLRIGFGYRQLHSVPLDPARQADWRAYLDRLGQYSFSRTAPSVAELDGVIREARAWLGTKAADT
jgi:hypothetical protein